MTTATKETSMNTQAMRAVRDAFAKLAPREQAKNPVMLMVYLSAVLTLILFVLSLFGISDSRPGFILAISIMLWLTVLFANFAEALAEGRGKAQAETLKKTKKDTVAHLVLPDGSERDIPACEGGCRREDRADSGGPAQQPRPPAAAVSACLVGQAVAIDPWHVVVLRHVRARCGRIFQRLRRCVQNRAVRYDGALGDQYTRPDSAERSDPRTPADDRVFPDVSVRADHGVTANVRTAQDRAGPFNRGRGRDPCRRINDRVGIGHPAAKGAIGVRVPAVSGLRRAGHFVTCVMTASISSLLRPVCARSHGMMTPKISE